MEGLCRRLFDRSDHPLGLAIRPWMVRLGETMLDAVILAGAAEDVTDPSVRHALVSIDKLHPVIGLARHSSSLSWSRLS